MSTAAAEALTPPAAAPPLPPVPPPPPAAAAEEPPRPTAAPPVPPPQAEAQVTEETDSAVSVSEIRAYKGSTLEKTGKFEDLRKAHFTTLYDNNSLYWQSFVELIKRNQTSNEKTIAFLTAKIAAARAYCNALYGIRDTVAGNKHGTTAAVRERERAGVRKTACQALKSVLLQGRQSSHLAQDSGLRQGVASTATAVSVGAITSTSCKVLMLPDAYQLLNAERYHSSRGQSVDVAGRTPSALEHMFDMEEKTAQMMLTFCDEIETDVLQKMLQAMASDLSAQFEIMVNTGSACLKVLAQYEANSAQAFEALRSAAMLPAAPPAAAGTVALLLTALVASVSAPMPGSAAAVAAAQDIGSSSSSSGEAVDVWVLDMAYRVAVSQQLAVCDAASSQLGALFGRMKDLEVNRRLAIRNALLSVLQTQCSVIPVTFSVAHWFRFVMSALAPATTAGLSMAPTASAEGPCAA
eukprot:13965-Heterococcus_DN1.PRE.1